MALYQRSDLHFRQKDVGDMPQRLAAVRTVISRLREAWEGRAAARPLTGKAAFQAARSRRAQLKTGHSSLYPNGGDFGRCVNGYQTATSSSIPARPSYFVGTRRSLRSESRVSVVSDLRDGGGSALLCSS